MIVVMQCASRKQPEAGFMRAQDGRRVCFVADPSHAPADEFLYARPDDQSDAGPSWRELLRQYNAAGEGNPFGLMPAFALYRDEAYQRLANHVGIGNFYILSAGWGLIPGSFLTPYYDITFTAQANLYKRRRKSDVYHDFCMLPTACAEPITFFGSREYVPLFTMLTGDINAPKTVFWRSQVTPDLPGISVVRFETPRRTNWQYDYVNAFLNGKLALPSGAK